MRNIYFYSNLHNLESQRKELLELSDIIDSAEQFGLMPHFRNSILSSSNKSEDGIKNVENYSYYSLELCRLASANPEQSICILVFPKIFTSGHLFFIAHYLLSCKVKIFAFGMDSEQKPKTLFKFSQNLKVLDQSVLDSKYKSLLFDKDNKIANIKAVARNIIWSGIFGQEFNRRLITDILEVNLTGQVDEIVAKTFLSEEMLVNLMIANSVIARYRMPLEDLMKSIDIGGSAEIKKTSRMLSFFFFNKPKELVQKLFNEVVDKKKIEAHSQLSTTVFLNEVLTQIWNETYSSNKISVVKKQFIKFFIQSRIKEDPIVAAHVPMLSEVSENDLRERTLFRKFISDFTGISSYKPASANLGTDETKLLLKEFSRFLQNKKVFSGRVVMEDMEQFTTKLGLNDPFFLSAIFKKLLKFYVEQPMFLDSTSFKHVVPKIKFNEEETKEIFNFLQREYFVDFQFFSGLVNKLAEEKTRTDQSRLVEHHKVHFQKKIKILPEFNYIFLSYQTFSPAEKFMVKLGKYQLNQPFIPNISEPATDAEAASVGWYFNYVLIHPVEEFFKKDFLNKGLLLQAHKLFIERAVFKVYKSFAEGEEGVVPLRSISEHVPDESSKSQNQTVFNSLFEKIVNEEYICIGYHQLYSILSKKSGFNDRQLLNLGYQSTLEYPEDPFFQNHYLYETEAEKNKNIDMLPDLYKNIILNYTNFINDIKKATENESDFVLQSALNSLLVDLQRGSREVLSNFRERNPFSSLISNILASFYNQNSAEVNACGNLIRLGLNDKFNFFKFFVKEVIIDSAPNPRRFVFYYSPGAENNPLSEKFLLSLEHASSSKYFSEFEKMLQIYRYLVFVNKYLCAMQQLAGVKMVYDILAHHSDRLTDVEHLLNPGYFTTVPDEKKMLICTHEASGKINTNIILNKPVNLSKLTESFSSINEGLNTYVRIFEEIEEHLNYMLSFNEVFAQIPNIKFAPKPLKLFRQNIKNIAVILSKRFEDFSLKDIAESDLLCYQSWNHYLEMVKMESGFPSNYKFFDIGLKQFKIHIGSAKFENFLFFIRNGFNKHKHDKKLNTYFTHRLEQAITIREKLAKKEYFFIVPMKEMMSSTVDCVRNLKKVKGLTCNVIVDLKDGESNVDELMDYIPPHSFFKFSK